MNSLFTFLDFRDKFLLSLNFYSVTFCCNLTINPRWQELWLMRSRRWPQMWSRIESSAKQWLAMCKRKKRDLFSVTVFDGKARFSASPKIGKIMEDHPDVMELLKGVLELAACSLQLKKMILKSRSWRSLEVFLCLFCLPHSWK